MVARLHIDYGAATNGGAGRRYAQDKTIASCEDSRVAQAQLYPRALSWLQLFYVEQSHPRRYFLRATVKIHLCVVGERTGSVCQQLDMGIDEYGWAELAGGSNDISSCEVCARDIGQVHGDAAAWLHDLHLMLVCLQAANT